MKITILKIVVFILGHIPLFLMGFIGKGIGHWAFMIMGSRRRETVRNLQMAFGKKKSPRDIRFLCRLVFENLGLNFMEFMRLPWLRAEDLPGYVETKGFENIEKAQREGRGVIICTAHFGNWELMSTVFALKGFPPSAVVRKMDSGTVDQIVHWIRTSSGAKVVDKKKAMRPLLKLLGEKEVVGILMDQNVTASEGVFVDFFGKKACTNKGPAMLAVRTNAAVLPAFIIRNGLRHRVIIGEELEMIDTGDREADAIENTARMTDMIEDVATRHPEQWFWVHRRWKTRPENEKEGE